MAVPNKCPHCGEDCVMGVHVFVTGFPHIVEICVSCSDKKGYLVKPKPSKGDWVKRDGWENLPLLYDGTIDAPPCAVRGCERKGVMLHHFFPRHLFDYADDAPTAYLCYYHHMQEWHAKLTPNMSEKDLD